MPAPSAAQQPARSTPRLTTFAALGARTFRLYWFGLILYVVGYRAETVTAAWLVWELTNDPLYLGYIGLAQGVPLVLLQIFGGVLADRTNRMRLLLVTQTLTALTLATALALTITGQIRVEHLMVLSVVSGIFRAFDEPSRAALLPQLIDRARFANAVALGSIPWQGGRVIGPSITGVLIAAFGAGAGFALATFSCFGALALYSLIRLGAQRPGVGQGVLRELLEGLSFIWNNPLFASLIGMAFCNSVFGMSYVTLLPIYADEYFQAGATGYGLMQAAHGAGAVVGTLGIATIGDRLSHRGKLILVGGGGFGLLLMLFSLTPTLSAALVVLVLMGFSNTFYLTLVNTVLQQKVPDELRGRVLSTWALCFNLIPIGGVLFAVLAAAVDARFAALFGGAVVAVVGFGLLACSRSLRELE